MPPSFILAGCRPERTSSAVLEMIWDFGQISPPPRSGAGPMLLEMIWQDALRFAHH